MKRLFSVLLAMLLLCSAALAEDALRGYDKKNGYVYVTLGQCPQTEEGGMLPILWRVLAVEEDRALLLSEYVLEARPIHSDYKEYANKPTNKKKPGFDGDFTQTEMFEYLNGAFLENSFTEKERSALAETEELGKLFLLSSEDLKNQAYGFTSNESRKAWGTPYALVAGESPQNLFRYSNSRGGHSPYWTRSQSTSNIQAARCIKSKGELGYINVITLNEGMRPACYVDMALLQITGGEGTKDEPFTLGILSADATEE